MIKRILVPTDGSDAAMVGVRYAVALARRCGATLCGLHVVDVKLLEGPFLRDLSASLGTAPYVNYQGNITLLLEERGRAALSAFQSVCEEAGAPCETAQATGIVAREIVEHSSLADLVVMGRGGEHSAWLEGMLGSTTRSVIRRSSRPVLVTGVDQLGDQRLLAAYDGSAYADRALQVAAELATNWGAALHVLVVGEEVQEDALAGARQYLQAHGVAGQWELRPGDPREEIVAYAGACGADLLIMGAYGHSKMHELVLGSTTNYVIHHAPCPALLTR
ncbi:MAG TPA: universal stress protein [Candidatus Hydrogenedentes bacterium]|nr:universal stress protein [Candidatus Hydrogenedentota bacterium]